MPGAKSKALKPELKFLFQSRNMWAYQMCSKTVSSWLLQGAVEGL